MIRHFLGDDDGHNIYLLSFDKDEDPIPSMILLQKMEEYWCGNSEEVLKRYFGDNGWMKRLSWITSSFWKNQTFTTIVVSAGKIALYGTCQ